MSVSKRLIIGMAYSVPFIGLISYLISTVSNDPKIIEVIKIAGYATLGMFVILVNLFILLAVFSSSLIALKYFLNMNKKDKNIE